MSIERAAARLRNCLRWSEDLTRMDGIGGFSSDFRKGQAAAYRHAFDIVNRELRDRK